jgi:hypothetical protein
MSEPAVKLRQFLGGQDALTVTPGQDDLELLIPGQETLAGGVCPLQPSLIQAVDVAEPMATGRVRSGQRWTRGTGTKRRGELEVRWTTDKADHDTLRAFFRDEVGEHLRPFFVDIDLDANLVGLRPLAPPQYTWETKAGWSITCRCEEMFG